MRKSRYAQHAGSSLLRRHAHYFSGKTTIRDRGAVPTAVFQRPWVFAMDRALFVGGRAVFHQLKKLTADVAQFIQDILGDGGYAFFLLRGALAVVYVAAIVGVKLGAGSQKAVFIRRSHFFAPFMASNYICRPKGKSDINFHI